MEVGPIAKGDSIDDLTAQLEELALERLSSSKAEGNANSGRPQKPTAHVLSPEDFAALEGAVATISSSMLSPGSMNDATAAASCAELAPAVTFVRRMMSMPDCLPAAEALELGIVPLMARIAAYALHDVCSHATEMAAGLASSSPQFECEFNVVKSLDNAGGGDSNLRQGMGFDALWCLNNVAAGPSQATQLVVSEGALAMCVSLANECDASDLLDVACYLIGNVAGDSADGRDCVLEHGAAPAVARAVSVANNLNVLRNAAWALSNMIRFKPAPAWEHAQTVLGTAQSLLMQFDDDDVVADSLWCFAYGIEAPYAEVIIQEIIRSQMLPGLINTVANGKPMARAAALRVIGNVVTSCDSDTQAVIDAGGLQVILQGLASGQFGRLAHEALWFLSNIAAGSAEQIHLLLDEGGVNVALRWLTPLSPTWQEAKEALWTVTNAVAGASWDDLKRLRNDEVFQGLCNYCAGYAGRQPRPISGIGEAFDRLLFFSEENGAPVDDTTARYAAMVRECLSPISNLPDEAQHVLERLDAPRGAEAVGHYEF